MRRRLAASGACKGRAVARWMSSSCVQSSKVRTTSSGPRAIDIPCRRDHMIEPVRARPRHRPTLGSVSVVAARQSSRVACGRSTTAGPSPPGRSRPRGRTSACAASGACRAVWKSCSTPVRCPIRLSDVQVAECRLVPFAGLERGEQPVDRCHGSAQRLDGGDGRRLVDGPSRRSGRQCGTEDGVTQAGGRPLGICLCQCEVEFLERIVVTTGFGHTSSRRFGSSQVWSFDWAKRNRDLAVPSGMPSAVATSRWVRPLKKASSTTRRCSTGSLLMASRTMSASSEH